MMSFFGGGGGRGWSDEEYEAYVKKLQQEREERYNRMMNEQRLVDSTTDPAQRLALQRRRYKCEDNFVTVSNIPAWVSMAAQLKQKAATAPPEQESNNNNSGGGGGGFWMMRRPTLKFERTDKQARYPVDDELNAKIGLIRGDITSLEVDAIVNAANSSLLGGGGVDGAIHSAAGPLLEEECRGLNGANTGETKITKGFALPARFVLHTVGPIERGDRQLRACYRSSLDLCIKHGIKTVAFCCISTGIYSFPLKRATHIALDETRKFLNSLKNGTYVAGPEASNEPRRSRFSKNDKDDDAEQQQQQQKNNEQEKQQQKEKVPAVQPGLGAIEKIIFCVFTAEELQAYEGLLGSYFPIEGFYAEQYKIPENPEEHDDFNRDDARPEWNPSSASSHSGGSGGGGMGSNITFIGGSK